MTTIQIFDYMTKVKVTEYKGYQIIHGTLFKKIIGVDGPYCFRTTNEAKKYINENLIGNEKSNH